jgi:hypothetical protein
MRGIESLSAQDLQNVCITPSIVRALLYAMQREITAIKEEKVEETTSYLTLLCSEQCSSNRRGGALA